MKVLKLESFLTVSSMDKMGFIVNWLSDSGFFVNLVLWVSFGSKYCFFALFIRDRQVWIRKRLLTNSDIELGLVSLPRLGIF